MPITQDILKISLHGEDYEIFLDDSLCYGNGVKAIQAFLKTHEPFGKVTVNLPDAPVPDESHIYVKTWSENAAWVPQLLEVCDFFEDTGRRIPTGGYDAEAQVWRLK